MSLKQLQLGTAFRLLAQTIPILLIRLGVYLGFWILLLIYLGLLIGIGFLLSRIWEPLGLIIGLIAFATTIPIYRLAYKYVFYLLKAAHIAVVAELLENGSLPQGASQLGWGKDQVTDRFGAVSAMFVVDELIAGIVRTFTNAVFSVASWVPGDSMRGLIRILNRIVDYATNYVDEAILARSFWRREKNIWQSAQEGIVLYGMVWRPLLVNAIALMLLSYVPFFVFLLLFAAPIGLLLGAISPALGGWSVLVILILAFFVKIAVGDSFAMIAMVASYQRETRGLAPDPAMEAQIAHVSDQFGELKRRAMEKMPRGGRVPGLPPSEPIAPAPQPASGSHSTQQDDDLTGKYGSAGGSPNLPTGSHRDGGE